MPDRLKPTESTWKTATWDELQRWERASVDLTLADDVREAYRLARFNPDDVMQMVREVRRP